MELSPQATSQITGCQKGADQTRSPLTEDQYLFAFRSLPPVPSHCRTRWFGLFKTCFILLRLPLSEQPSHFEAKLCVWLLIHFLVSAFAVCQVWRTCRLTCSNSLTRLAVPGYPIRPWLTGLSSLALTNQFTPSTSGPDYPSPLLYPDDNNNLF